MKSYKTAEVKTLRGSFIVMVSADKQTGAGVYTIYHIYYTYTPEQGAKKHRVKVSTAGSFHEAIRQLYECSCYGY